MGRLLTTFKDKTFEPSMKSYYQLLTDDIVTAPQIYDSLLYVKGSNAGSLFKGQENDDDVSTVEIYDTYMPVRFHNVKSTTDGTTPASATHTFFSVYNRAELKSPNGQNMYEMWGDYNTSVISDKGFVTNILGGGYNEARDNGSGDDQTIPAIYGGYNLATVQPTGDNRVATSAVGSYSRLTVNKDNVTVTNSYGSVSEVQATNGTFTNIFVHSLDLDFGGSATIANAYFIRAHDTTMPSVSGEAYFIKSNVPWQTLLSGPLTNTGAVSFSSTLAVASNTTIGGTLAVTGNTTVGGTLVVTGAATFNANVGLQDDDKLQIGTGNDLELYHDGDNSYIVDTGAGDLIIDASDDIYLKTNSGSEMARFNSQGILFTPVFNYKVKVSPYPNHATLTAAKTQEINTFSDADGATITLPDSGGGALIGVTFEFYILVTATSNEHRITFTDHANEKFYGALHAVDIDGTASSSIWHATANAGYDSIHMNGTTTGLQGTRIKITNIAADHWHVEGNVLCSGTPATPFIAQ